MQFSGIQLAAVAKLASNLAMADGKVDPVEIGVVARWFETFHVPIEAAKTLVARAREMPESEAIDVISQLSHENKEHITAWLLAVVIADRIIDEREKKLLYRYERLCGLPPLRLHEENDPVVQRATQAQAKQRPLQTPKTIHESSPSVTMQYIPPMPEPTIARPSAAPRIERPIIQPQVILRQLIRGQSCAECRKCTSNGGYCFKNDAAYCHNFERDDRTPQQKQYDRDHFLDPVKKPGSGCLVPLAFVLLGVLVGCISR